MNTSTSVPQSAILPANSRYASFVTLNLADVATAAHRLRAVAGRLATLTAEIASIDPGAELLSAIGFSAAVWPRLHTAAMPAELHPLATLAGHGHELPSTPGDALLYVRCARTDLNFMLVQAVMGELGDAVTVVEHIDGFRYQDMRDMTGFVDGTENPEGEERAEAALVAAADPDFAGGSYLLLMRFVHNLAAWNQHPVVEQEQVIGRTKHGDEELDDDAKPASAHLARVVIEEDGEELEILRQSMPYGDASRAGLMFLAFSHTTDYFERMLRRMYQGDADGSYDRLLDFTRAETGHIFFVPSETFLAAWSVAP